MRKQAAKSSKNIRKETVESDKQRLMRETPFEIFQRLVYEDKELKKLAKELRPFLEKKYKQPTILTFSVYNGAYDSEIVYYYDEDLLESRFRKSEEYLNDRKKVKELFNAGVAIAKDINKREKLKVDIESIKNVVCYMLF